MEFISAQLSILIWLVLISFILAKFPVEQLKILISGGTGTGTFSSKEEQQYCMSFWVYAKHFPFSSNSTRSEQPWQISLNALLTPYLPPPTHFHACATAYAKPPLPSLYPYSFFPLLFSSWLSLSGSAQGKESALICQSEQPFHRVSLCSIPVPEWELLISPGRLANRRLVGSPAGEGQREGGSAGVRALVRAWQAADKSSSCCSCMHLPLLRGLSLPLSVSLSLSSTHWHAHTHSFSPHMWGTNNNFGVLVSQPSFLRQG